MAYAKVLFILFDNLRLHFKGNHKKKHKLSSYERASKMPKNDICITVIGEAVLEIFHFKVDIPRKSPKIRISLNVSIKSGEQSNS